MRPCGSEHHNQNGVYLWFDACLFDQSMLCHLLAYMGLLGIEGVDLICVDAFQGIEPYHGLGQLSPDQLETNSPVPS